MNATGNEREAGPAQARRDGNAGGADENCGMGEGIALVSALQHLLVALRKLAVAEGRVLLAGIPLLFIAAVALIAFSVSLWVCLVALIGWALMQATHSLGLALGLLVIIHAVLVIGVWSIIKYSIRQATFPRARDELRLLGRALRQDFERITGATPLASRGMPSQSASRERGDT